jgi:small-conductance mechanosensitive channel
VNPRAGLDNIEKRKFLTLLGVVLRPLGRPARNQSLYRPSYPGSLLAHIIIINIIIIIIIIIIFILIIKFLFLLYFFRLSLVLTLVFLLWKLLVFESGLCVPAKAFPLLDAFQLLVLSAGTMTSHCFT